MSSRSEDVAHRLGKHLRTVEDNEDVLSVPIPLAQVDQHRRARGSVLDLSSWPAATGELPEVRARPRSHAPAAATSVDATGAEG